MIPVAGDAKLLTEAWRQCCADLATAGDAVEGQAKDGAALDLVDGYHQLGALLESALRWYLRGSDPDFPRFVEINDTPEIADNIFAAVRGDATYSIRGNVASLFDFNISVHTGWGWLKPSKSSGDLGCLDLQVEPNGTVEIVASATPHAGNWLPLPPDAEYVQVREYHAGYGQHCPGTWSIVRVGGEGDVSARMTPGELRSKLELALAWVRGYLPFHIRSQAALWPKEANGVTQPITHPGGNRHIWYGFGRFTLAPDEALVLEFDEPQARLWNVQWLSSPWYENPDMANRFSGLPSGEAHVDTDGRVRVVLCAADPGVPNWLDVSGYQHGYIVTRWIWCEQGPTISHSVIPVDQLRYRLPRDTPIVSSTERAVAMNRRRVHFACRRR
jgi:hypothetical protein